MRFPPPDRVWEKWPDNTWSSREWYPGEKQEYQGEVGYTPPVDNSKEAIATLCEMWGTK